jgi:hypothetical protein
LTQSHQIEYEVELSEDKPSYEVVQKIGKVLKEHADEDADLDPSLSGEEVRLYGYQTLSWGDEPDQSQREEHKEIVQEVHKIDPKAKVTTRWMYTDKPWDYEFSTEDDDAE